MSNATIKQIFQEFPSNALSDDDLLVFYNESTGITRAIKASDAISNTSSNQEFTWVSGATYMTSDPVVYQGEWWISLLDNNTGNIPTEDTNWTRENKVTAITIEPWQSGIFEQSYTVVSVGSKIYRLKPSAALPFSSQTSPDSDTTNWELFQIPSFLDLTDTPSSYTGQAGNALVANSAENGTEFANLYPVDATGAEIDFTEPKTYGSDTAPITATTLTNTDTGAKRVIQKIYHQAASLTLPTSWVKLASSRDYVAGAVNIIFVEYESASRKIYSITQDA